MSSSSSSRANALKKIIKRLPARLTYYSSALGAIVLAAGGQLPPGLEFVAGGIGANLLSNLVDEIARGEDILDDEIIQRTEDAITKSDIANLLTKQDFLQGYARLLKRLDDQKAINQDILAELRIGFSSVATAEQVEELKRIIVELTENSRTESKTGNLIHNISKTSSSLLRVFISSTAQDLVSYRNAVTNVTLRLGMYPIVMEAFNPTDRNALQLCYDKVQEAHIFVGIYAHRYGYVPGTEVSYVDRNGTEIHGDGNKSITHLEYLWATERNLPMLLFLVGDKDPNGDPIPWPVSLIEDNPGKERLVNLKEMLKTSHVVGFFHSPDNLATQVATGISEFLQRQSRTTAIVTSPTGDGEFSHTDTSLITGCKNIRISITQFFRMLDFLIYPQNLASQAFQKCLTDVNYLRRFVNNSKPLIVENLGKLRPVIDINSSERFWRIGAPRLNRPTASTINFFPFHLSLTNQLRRLSASDLSLPLQPTDVDTAVVNKQVSGDLRLYPPGIGAIRLNVMLQFSDWVDIDQVAQIARYYEEQMFVDAEGNVLPCERVFVDAIERTSFALFGNDDIGIDRRWMPPFIKYTIRNDDGLHPERISFPLSKLLFETSQSELMIDELVETVRHEIISTHWQREGTLILVNKGAACTLVDDAAFRNHKKGRFREEWLEETTQLALAVVYVLWTVTEEFDPICNGRILNRTWYPGSENFTYLFDLLSATKRALGAVSNARKQIHNQGTGSLVDYANSLWSMYDTRTQDLNRGLDYISEWSDTHLKNLYEEQSGDICNLISDITHIISLSKLNG